MENDEINLDWMFKSSLLSDLGNVGIQCYPMHKKTFLSCNETYFNVYNITGNGIHPQLCSQIPWTFTQQLLYGRQSMATEDYIIRTGCLQVPIKFTITKNVPS